MCSYIFFFLAFLRECNRNTIEMCLAIFYVRAWNMRPNCGVILLFPGLCSDAINLISAVVRNHFLPYPAAEVVLRHWQYVYNKYGVTGEDGKCPIACTKESLVNILREMNRHDLVELFESH
jgi:hypothetical protein